MKIVSVIGLISAFLLAIIVYLTTNNYIFALVFLFIFLGYFMVIAYKMIKKYLSRKQRCHDCYKFINSFLITMSVKESLTESFSSGTINASLDFKSELSELENMVVEDRIIYLRRYFNLAIYKMFLNVLNIYQEQGGNILSMSESLMHESTLVEESVNKSSNIGIKKLTEFLILWILTFFVLLFMRFGMKEFYLNMINNNMFIACLLIFFLFFVLSFHLFLINFTKLAIKEDNINEED